MMLWIHFLASSALALILFPLFGISSFYIIVGGFLIDIDHIFYFTWRFKSLNLKKARAYFMGIKYVKEYKKAIRPLHNVETFIIMIALSSIINIFLFIIIGFVLHMAMDMYDEYRKYSTLQNYSLLYRLFKQKAL